MVLHRPVELARLIGHDPTKHTAEANPVKSVSGYPRTGGLITSIESNCADARMLSNSDCWNIHSHHISNPGWMHRRSLRARSRRLQRSVRHADLSGRSCEWGELQLRGASRELFNQCNEHRDCGNEWHGNGNRSSYRLHRDLDGGYELVVYSRVGNLHVQQLRGCWAELSIDYCHWESNGE